MNQLFDSSLLSALSLQNPKPNTESRVGIVSLPVPLAAEPPAGMEGLATHGVDIAWWPPSRSGNERVPRRRMMYVVSDCPFPSSIRLGRSSSLSMRTTQATLSLRDVHKDYKSLLPRHVGELVL